MNFSPLFIIGRRTFEFIVSDNTAQLCRAHKKSILLRASGSGEGRGSKRFRFHEPFVGLGEGGTLDARVNSDVRILEGRENGGMFRKQAIVEQRLSSSVPPFPRCVRNEDDILPLDFVFRALLFSSLSFFLYFSVSLSFSL